MTASQPLILRVPIEVLFTLGILVLAVIIAVSNGLVFNLPDAQGANFVGVHYFYPLFAVVIWLGCSALSGRKVNLASTLTMLGCYALVMLIHFNIKLWMPFVNSNNFDHLYWKADESVRPIIDVCIALTAMLRDIHPIFERLYMIGFMALFFISFCLHAVRSPLVFRKVFLAAIFLQGLGAVGYLIMPALGPFLYEPGAIPSASQAQALMLEAHRAAMLQGPDWVATWGQAHLLTGLAAMPSLHAGGSFLFLFFIARYERPLLVIYLPMLLFILIAAVGTRWHYAIDLPVGIALAGFCIWLAYRLDGFALNIPLPLRIRQQTLPAVQQ